MAIVVAVVNTTERVAESTVGPKPRYILFCKVTVFRRKGGDVVVHGQG